MLPGECLTLVSSSGRVKFWKRLVRHVSASICVSLTASKGTAQFEPTFSVRSVARLDIRVPHDLNVRLAVIFGAWLCGTEDCRLSHPLGLSTESEIFLV
ncbi:hypothetical protein N658DRAFT_58067 [Parathielavia hyrcaniae]|uniref:Uncharacterized protein n=1 Tax=Parathielavia hyrcaniae TaxID=113614 RepID=A0AAN6Q0I6_9PEZI|nr:hypothetical protein N658DRAFT_58067 [Parathielavia hyrcaniae]